MSGRVLLNNAIWSLISHVLQRGSIVLGAIYLARGLPPSQFATYSYFQLTASTLATYAAMGLGTTASRLFAEVGHTGHDELPPLGLLLIFSVAVPLISFVLLAVLPDGWLGGGFSIPRWVIATGVAISVAGIVPSGGILGLEKYRTATVVSLVSAVIMLALVAIAVREKSALLAELSLIIGLAIQAIGQMFVVVYATGCRALRTTFRWSLQDVRTILLFAGPMTVVSVLTGSVPWIVGRWILATNGDHEFAVFSIGLQWLGLGLLLPGMVSRVVLPRLVRDSSGQSKGLVRTAAVLALAPAVLLFACSYLTAPWLMNWYGPAYRDAYWVIPAFLLVATVSAAITTIGNAIIARDGQWKWLRFTSLWFISILALLMALPSSTALWASAAYGGAAFVMLIQCAAHAKNKGFI